jgi:precorrin-6Y C5,15-methyltransferase (decarboxylating)
MVKIHLIGMSDAGLDSLSSHARALVESARFIAGGKRHLERVGHLPAEKLAVDGDLDGLAGRLKAEAGRDLPGAVVVLASGDPLFYGIGKALIERLGPDQLEVHPGLSSMQLAFARVGLSWEDASLVSVHGRSLAPLLAMPPTAVKLGVFTDDKNTPGIIATFLMAQGWPANSEAWVLENLEGRDEKVTALRLQDLASRSFGPLNVMLARRSAPTRPADLHAFALPDAEFSQRKPQDGLITKAEVRAVALSKLRLFPSARVWDVGAGSGSVSVEAARLCRQGRVWAVEKNAEDCAIIRQNIAKFHVPNMQLVEGRAPEALKDLPEPPDAVFVGGSGGGMSSLLSACQDRLKPGGSLVVDTVTVENTGECLAWFKASGLEWDFVLLQVARRRAILSLNRLEALNPVYVFWGLKAMAPAPAGSGFLDERMGI